ncbi:MAG: ABC transporter permease, partial [Patescibacteria group bacterium]
MITLALQNITERKSRVILASLSIAIGTASLIVFLGLSNGIEQATFSELEKKSPLTQITVSPNTKETGIISLLSKTTDGKLNKETIEQISKINGVKNIYPEIQFNNFASLEVPIFGMTLATETMIFGVPTEFIENDISSREIWNKNEEPYP